MGVWTVTPSKYRGLTMRCAPGLHEAAFALLSKHVSPLAGVLDLGAGTGAMLARLKDARFTDLHAVELDVENFSGVDIAPRPLDLNLDFSNEFERSFELITALEITEHLDSPRHFLAQIFKLLEPGGYLLLSTPNVSTWLGRIQFLRSGDLRYFDRHQYFHQRHVSPTTHTFMELMLAELGYAVVESTTGGEHYGVLKKLVTAPIHVPFRLAFGPRVYGDISVYLAQKPSAK